ncbi:MAG: peptide deformylase [Candidatus Shikimatogenerans bostrichidophilus]|nr:MAG: peptide deformylase [Candidatus Shikimatogenerans bostrichidophilus]
MIFPILLYNNNINKKILRNKNNKIKKFLNLNNIINNMFETMFFYNGVGLSAPQIGININLFIISFYKKKMIFINSKIKKYSNKNILSKEGCLSIPNKNIIINRKKYIYVKYYDNKWKKHNKKLKNFFSIIFQHEYDHIKGKLIIDYI